MSYSRLLDTLKSKQIKLVLQGDAIKVLGRKENLTPEIISSLKLYKQELIPWLKRGGVVTRDTIEPYTGKAKEHPLSSSQQDLWLIDTIQGSSVHYNMPVVLDIQGSFDPNIANEVFKEIVQRHTPLRTVYIQTSDEEPVQKVLEDVEFQIQIVDISHSLQAQQQKIVEQFINEEMNTDFDLGRDIMLRGSVLVLAKEQFVLVLNTHHIASDGWSSRNLLNEFTILYRARLSNRQAGLVKLPIQYTDFARWQRQWLKSECVNGQLAYWKASLDGAPAVHEIPLDFSRSGARQGKGGSVNSAIDYRTLTELTHLARTFDMSLFMLIHGLLCLLIARHSGTNDIVVGTLVAGRGQAILNPLIGYFVNTLPLRVSTQFEDFKKYLEHVRQVNIEAQENQDIPFEVIVKECEYSGNNNVAPLTQIILTVDNNDVINFDLPDAHVTRRSITDQYTKFDLYINVEESVHGMTIEWLYNRELFIPEHIGELSGQLETLIKQVVNNKELNIPRLPELFPDHNKLQSLNNTQVAFSDLIVMQSLFELRAAQIPNQIALYFDGNELNYSQLDRAANRLAHYLVEKGIGRNDLVGICAERSFETVIAIYAVLKAGELMFQLNQRCLMSVFVSFYKTPK